MPKFILPKAPKGLTVIADRYAFEDGVMQVSKSDAPKIEKILCRFHGCELINDEPEEQTESNPEADSSLAVQVTKSDQAAKTAQTETKQDKQEK